MAYCREYIQAVYPKKGPSSDEFAQAFSGAYWVTPESEYIKDEELRILRRELSLLSKQYRDVTLAYYIHGKSCSDIAADLGISVNMVKYYLFQTRKLLKEGFEMTREFGEKSYNPAVFRLDFWGNNSSGYWQLFERRKLPGNILLAAYEAPLTVKELSLELGVSTVYLEDELEILLSYGFLRKVGERFQTNIVIFTSEYEKTVAPILAPIYEETAERLSQELAERLPALRNMEFKGNDYSEARLKWELVNCILMQGLTAADEESRKRFGGYPSLSNGGHGFLFGHDNDYLHHHFNGIYGRCENKAKTAYFSVVNYRVIEPCQNWKPGKWEQSMEAMCDAILEKGIDADNEMLLRFIDENIIFCKDGRLLANFPVFTSGTMDTLRRISADLIDMVSRCMMEACDTAAKTLKEFVPKALRDECEQLCFVRHSMDTMAGIVEKMVKDGILTLPDQKESLTIFGVSLKD